MHDWKSITTMDTGRKAPPLLMNYWDKKFRELQACQIEHEKNTTSFSPSGVFVTLETEYTSLGRWLTSQKRLYKKNRLSRVQQHQLESIPGFSSWIRYSKNVCSPKIESKSDTSIKTKELLVAIKHKLETLQRNNEQSILSREVRNESQCSNCNTNKKTKPNTSLHQQPAAVKKQSNDLISCNKPQQGDRVAIFWNTLDYWYSAIVLMSPPSDNKIFVQYLDDKSRAWVDLSISKWQKMNQEETDTKQNIQKEKLIESLKVGARLKVTWSVQEDELSMFAGTMTKVDQQKKENPHFIEYDDGDTEWTNLLYRAFISIGITEKAKKTIASPKKITPEKMVPKNTIQNIFKLESQEYKDSIVKKGDVVYAPYPGKQPKNESYYWGTISKIFPAPESKQKSVLSYSIQFPDGDVTKRVNSEHFYRYEECTCLMKKGWLDNDIPPESLFSNKNK